MQFAEERWQQIKNLWKQYQSLYILAGFLGGLLIGSFLPIAGGMLRVLENLGPEVIGIAFTVFVIDRIYRRQELEREERSLKERLIRELGSRDNETALWAAEALRKRGWLTDGALHEADLRHANLENVNLSYADLQNANLEFANLRKANLSYAQLQTDRQTIMPSYRLFGTFLGSANLEEANLISANLQGANLFNANLEAALLGFANLKGADLRQANLQRVAGVKTIEEVFGPNRPQLDGEWGIAKFDEHTTLPDDTKWSPEVSMLYFTDSTHPNFWRSDERGSPAYRAKRKVVKMTQPSDFGIVVQQTIEEYAKGETLKAVTYPVSDETRQSYTIVVVPDQPRKYKSMVAIMARVVGDTVVIDEDITDRPLWEALVRAGIPREKIILTYAGETLPEQPS